MFDYFVIKVVKQNLLHKFISQIMLQYSTKVSELWKVL